MSQDSIQQQARALGDPTRHRIFRYIADSPTAVGVKELTDRFELNHNAIRQHLAKLVDAGLVIRQADPATGRGRPRQVYEIDPVIEERWGVGGPYRRLSLLLVEMLRTGGNALDVGRRAGREVDLGRGDLDPIARLERAMMGSGFDPLLVSDEGPAEFVLRNCPFSETASADPATVCALHLGMAQGMAESLDGVVVDELELRDPALAGCRLRFHLDDSAA